MGIIKGIKVRLDGPLFGREGADDQALSRVPVEHKRHPRGVVRVMLRHHHTRPPDRLAQRHAIGNILIEKRRELARALEINRPAHRQDGSGSGSHQAADQLLYRLIAFLLARRASAATLCALVIVEAEEYQGTPGQRTEELLKGILI